MNRNKLNENKFVRSILTQGLISLILLVGTNSAQAATVITDPNNNDRATGILGLDVGGTFYDVTFVNTNGQDLYGGVFDFTTKASAETARDAVSDALIIASSTEVGPEGEDNGLDDTSFNIGYEFNVVPALVNVMRGAYTGATWSKLNENNNLSYELDVKNYASFSPAAAVPVPAAVWLFGSALGLMGWMRRKAA